jgi:hypothetical protein
MIQVFSLRDPRSTRICGIVALTALLSASAVQPAFAQNERMYFPAVENVANVLLEKINAETVRIDMSAWYLTEGLIVNALITKHQQGVPIRLIGDRGSIFEIDIHTKNAFYRLANAGVPIRLRFNPTWYPEIAHWKATIFVGQNLVTFGSANYTPFELAPNSSTDYKDETILFTDDAALVGAFKTKFDVMWNDKTAEPHSLVSNAPYFRDWHDACRRESACSDFATQYPTPAPMIIETARLEPDYPLPPEMVWGQGPLFNNRLIQEINKESTRIDFVIYRLTVDNITEALLAKHKAGVPIRIIIEPNEYRNRKWPEFWLTHANMDKLWAAGVPIKKRIHTGLTHMKMLVTSSVATNASSNLAAAWQRDHNYFVPAVTKPALYGAMRDRFAFMWNDATGFATFTPEAPDAPSLAAPAHQATGVSTSPTLVWNRAAFAVSYDVYLGTSSSNLTKVGNVPAQLVNNPPSTYSWTSPTALQGGTTYFWRIVSRTNATAVNSSLVGPSSTRSFTTGGTAPASPPAAPSSPTPASGATGISTSTTLTWAAQAAGTTYNVALGTSSPPALVAMGLTSASYTPGTLAPSTTYYWQVTAVNSAGSTAGPVWSFATATGTPPSEVVLYASDVTTRVGNWAHASDATAAGGVLLRSQDLGYSNTTNALASPPHYFEATFNALAGTRYRVWVRMRAKDDSKWNDSVFVQFSDSVNGSGNAIYRIGTTSAITENLWTCATCQTFNWGWSRHAYWLGDTGEVWFQNSGAHTIRIQTREDGVDIDQIVISPVTYLSSAPGPVSNDTTIVPKPGGGSSPAPPGVPSSPSPANGSTAPTSLTLTWSSTGATSYDVYFGNQPSPGLVATNHATNSFGVSGLSEGHTYYWRIVARNAQGTADGPVWSFITAVAPVAPPEIVIYASDIPTSALNGVWTKSSDAGSPLGVRLSTPDNGFASPNSPLANPTHYVDVTFSAPANTPYRIWLRLRALNNDKFNDAVWVQFSDARVNGSPVYPLNSTSGLLVNLATDAGASSLNNWGWHNTAYWLNQATTVTFANGGTHTMRIQVREDGVMVDQIVLSPSKYLQNAPGTVTNDSTIVPKP